MARFSGGLLAIAVLCGCAAEPAPPLPALAIDADRIAVAGLSSGAYMATQVHFAWSDRLRGAALVAGGPYGCAGGSLDTALGPCIEAKPFTPDPERLAKKLRERAVRGDIAPLSGLAGDRVWLLHGREDQVVAAAVVDSAQQLYRQLGADAPGLTVTRETGDFGHVLPTLLAGADCVAGGPPHLGACGRDAAGEAMQALFGEPGAEAGEASGELRRFGQEAYLEPGQDAQLAVDGYLYLPAACAAGERCGLLVAFHGCEQNADRVGEAFVRDAGFNRWADVHRVVVLYPQARSSYLPLNPKACWDWWGYTGPDYDTRRGAQLRWLASAMAAIGAPLQ
ncbi:extracellular catalytic domain type 2 short-chain-length polyhydroxyalkanoate depolymerase [Arenimonas terrae]|uniref:extracellular catalytic domain type 2 short-chain-length polyhydroxyalkanoate depolymerase n=1 Tax=Arenimonas terrae TaxID=2546226 RepID=UPI001FEA5164|nr:PHB depolymerase family esterase [Arenimonas terrae]